MYKLIGNSNYCKDIVIYRNFNNINLVLRIKINQLKLSSTKALKFLSKIKAERDSFHIKSQIKMVHANQLFESFVLENAASF